jgi:energy-coupling factor transporter ATP-binding protein EcfA2
VTVPRSNELTSTEVADAATVAALTFALAGIGRLIAAGTFFQLLSTVVFAVLASRRRTRVVVVSGWAAASMGVLLGGIGPVGQLATAALFGGTTGTALRRDWGTFRAIGLSLLVGWPVVAATTVAMLSIMTRLRELQFENVRNLTSGLDRVLVRIDGLFGEIGIDKLGDGLLRAVDWGIDYWYIATPMAQALITVFYALLAFRIGKTVARRVDNALGRASVDTEPLNTGPPLPLILRDAEVRRAGQLTDITSVDLEVHAGQFWTVLGPNGAGKSTLLHAIAGLDDLTLPVGSSQGAALGKPNGTALIGQRPDSQVLAPRVGDDVLWGLDAEATTDVSEILAAVGLAGFEHRETSALSGGELQRLAIGGALARRPSLLLSDESTAMLDPEGRKQVHGLLERLADFGTSVIHTTHLADELPASEAEVLRIGSTRTMTVVPDPDSRGPGETVLRVADLDVVHDAGSPWAAQALHDVNLELRAGELTLITGANGSGKSTLAWALVGLIKPTRGTISLADASLTGPTPRVAIAFQHARLQVLRSRVVDEIKAQADVEDVASALRAVGLDAPGFADRRIDELSGGEQRRVLLAGLLSRRPDVLILDEPLAGLDDEGRRRLRIAIQHFLGRRTAVAIVTHEPDWASDLVSQRVHLTDGRLRVLDQGASR